MDHQYALYVRDGSNLVGQVESYTRLAYSIRYNLGGPFTLEMPYNAPGRDLLLPNRSIDIEMDGQVIWSGRILEYSGEVGLESDTISFTGIDETGLLAWRLALPVPGTTTSDYSSASHDVRTGSAEAVIKGYVDANAGPSARISPVARQLITAMQVDYGRGDAMSERARFERLDELVQSIARRGGNLGYRVVGGTFEIYEARDLSASIIFQQPDTMSSIRYRYSASKSSFAFSGGAGEGTLRTIKEVANSQAINDDGLRESFVSRGDTNDNATLVQAAIDKLLTDAPKTAYEIIPIETEATRLYTDYWVGDLVGAIFRGVEVQALVQEIAFTHSADGVEIKVSIGDEIYGNVFSPRKKSESSMQSRLTRLEVV
jgi:hypothetical protein